MPSDRIFLFDNCQNVGLFYDDVFLIIIEFYFRSRIFGIDHLISNLHFHFDFLAVNHSAGAYSDDFRLLGLLLALSGKNDSCRLKVLIS